MKGVYFTQDEYLEKLNLDLKIKKFILSFEEIFSERIIDEVLIVSYNWEILTPIYFFCAHKICDNIKEIVPENKKILKESKVKDFEFFIEKILTKQCILNNEWIIAKDQIGWLFDAMFRMDDYYIWLNNTEYSFKEMEEKIWIQEETFMNIVKKFYSDLKSF